MKVSREQAAKNRARVVEVAGEQFRAHGFDGIGVADLMKQAGLTHGGFYGNFSSKDELAAEASRHAIDKTIERIRQEVDGAKKPLEAFVSLYLSPEHRDALANGCVLAALASDAARGSAKLRAGFELGIERYAELLEPMMDGETVAKRHEAAMGLLATLVGGLILSRTIASPDLSLAMLETVSKMALERSR
jgi:TetR/AcrR family transcriptional regulator, transcriptional repressor for nem operon